MAYIPEETRQTPFDENIVGNRTPIMDYVPTWGASKVNYDIITDGSGIVTSSEYREIQLNTGTDANGQAEIQTKLIGQYQAGTQAEVGWGVRIPSLPTGNQFGEWSYSRQAGDSGFGWGVDSTGIYIFYTNKGNKQKVYQADWNKNTFPSLDISDGLIYQCEFIWYGYGPIEFYIQEEREENEQTIRTLVHRINITGSTSVNDPNNPIRFDVENNGETSNFKLNAAGHQFSIVGGRQDSRKRPVSELLEDVGLQNTGSWQPVMAIRRKPTFRGGPNSVNVFVKSFNAKCSANAKFRLVSAGPGSITNGTWSDIEWGDESAIEMKTSSISTPLDRSGSVRPSKHAYAQGGQGNTASEPFQANTEIVLGKDTEVIIEAKLDSPASGETSDIAMDWQEQW